MKRLIILILLAITSVQLHAQSAKEILNKVTTQIKSYKNIQLDFNYSMLNQSLGIEENNKGKLTFKGNKYILNLTQLGLSIYSDGTNSYTYNSEANELTINNLEDGDQMLNPASLFSMYEKGFDGKYVGQTVVGGKKCHHLEMTPQKGNQVEFTKIEVFVNQETNLIEQAKMHVDGGTIYTLSIKNILTNQAINDSDFVFNQAKHPGIEVIDLR